jgi:hypothetical protein
MFALARAVTYAALLIGLVLIFVPARVLSWSGIVRPAAIEVHQVGVLLPMAAKVNMHHSATAAPAAPITHPGRVRSILPSGQAMVAKRMNRK